MKHTIILSANTNYRKLVKAQALLNEVELLFVEISQCYCTEMDESEVQVRFADGKATCEKAIERLLGMISYAVLFDGVDEYFAPESSEGDEVFE